MISLEKNDEISTFSLLLFIFGIMLALYLTTKVNLNDISSVLIGLTALAFGLTGFALKLSYARISRKFIVRSDAVEVGVITAALLSLFQAITFTLDLRASILGGMIVIVMAIMEEYFFTSVLDIVYNATGNVIYSNFLVALLFALYHKAVYGFAVPVLLVLFIGRIAFNYAYSKAGLDASIIAHLLLNSISLVR